jgi:hypothetical protein
MVENDTPSAGTEVGLAVTVDNVGLIAFGFGGAVKFTVVEPPGGGFVMVILSVVSVAEKVTDVTMLERAVKLTWPFA